jgi:hypothetical protein
MDLETIDLDTTDLVGSSYVARRLGIADPSALKLMRAGLFGRRYKFAQYEMVDPEPVETLLAERPLVTDLDSLPPALLARVGPPTKDDVTTPKRKWKGWHEAATREDQLAGIGRWWEIRGAQRLEGSIFVAMVSTCTVYVARISRCTSSESGTSWWCHLAEPNTNDADENAWRDIRVKTGPGGNIIRHRLA